MSTRSDRITLGHTERVVRIEDRPEVKAALRELRRVEGLMAELDRPAYYLVAAREDAYRAIDRAIEGAA